MKRILCYGDSNTWGQAVYTGSSERIADAKQWPNILQKLLGEDYWIVQEGLGGRVAGSFEERPSRNGKDSFEVIYLSASPIDLLIISLGTNDLKKTYGRSAQDIVADLLWYRDAVVEFSSKSAGKDAKLLYVCPANFTSGAGFEGDQALRAELINLMRTAQVPIMELNDLEMTSDGVHYSEATHQVVAARVKVKIEEMNI